MFWVGNQYNRTDDKPKDDVTQMMPGIVVGEEVPDLLRLAPSSQKSHRAAEKSMKLSRSNPWAS